MLPDRRSPFLAVGAALVVFAGGLVAVGVLVVRQGQRVTVLAPA
jgi:regulator of protease activity HflC (stomatin/prohibitin superfamily)